MVIWFSSGTLRIYRYAEKWSPEKWSPEKLSPENWSTEKYTSKIVLRQRNARKFERLFYFYLLIPLHTKKMFDVHLTILHAPNCRTLKEYRKICCRVLGFHRFITSENFTHTPRCSTLTPRFFVFQFSGNQFFGDHFSGDQFSGDFFTRGPFLGDYFSGMRFITYLSISYTSNPHTVRVEIYAT